MTEVKLCAIVGFFQDKIAGSRLLNNLEKYEIPSLWFDSRVYGFHAIDSSNISTDGMREKILNSKFAKLYDLGEDRPSQVGEGFNFLFKEAAKLGYNYVLCLGCDEYITGDIDLLKSNLARIPLNEPTRLRVPLIEHNPEGNHNAKHVQDRIVYMPEFVYIRNIHWIYWHNYFGKDKPVIMGTEKQCPLVFGIQVHHDDRIRPAWRNQLMDSFQKTQVKNEREALEKMVRGEHQELYEKQRNEETVSYGK